MQGLRRWPLAALSGAVLVAHLWLVDEALPPQIGEGAAQHKPARIDVAFVRQLAPAAPEPVAPAVRSAPRTAHRPAIDAPSAPDAAASAPIAETVTETVTQTAALPPVEPAPPLPDLPPAPTALNRPAAPALAASAADGPGSEWPPSTRLSYRLTGNYRGPVEGQARVEWLRSGTRYQVVMDLSIGPSFAPLMSRRVSSDGEITAQGLQPRRYDEETKIVLLAPRRVLVQMDADRVLLANGSSTPRPAGLQDSASQFVQLTWLFTTQPELLQAGRSIVLPLALPRQVEPWTYDVLDSEILQTPAGPVTAVHVKPRREPKPGSELTAEIWVAPSLQNLPVRILIRQDADTWIDLAVDRLPEQALPGK